MRKLFLMCLLLLLACPKKNKNILSGEIAPLDCEDDNIFCEEELDDLPEAEDNSEDGEK